MGRKALSTPTEAELEILQVLWGCPEERGTVRQVHNVLKDRRDTGYSTTLKMMQVMVEKGLLEKDETVRPQVFKPAEPEEKTQLRLLDSLIQRGFGGSAMKLVMRALSAERVTSEELAEAKKLIDQSSGSKK